MGQEDGTIDGGRLRLRYEGLKLGRFVFHIWYCVHGNHWQHSLFSSLSTFSLDPSFLGTQESKVISI